MLTRKRLRLMPVNHEGARNIMALWKSSISIAKLSISLAAMCAALGGPALADVKAGVEAWEAGDFGRAVAEWQGPADAGDADALFNLAQAHRLGRGVPADSQAARALYAQAAAKGHVKASDNYGLLLFQEGEQEKAMPLVRAAAERGDPRAQYVAGLAHFNGDYAPRDWVRAYALMTLANGAGLPQATSALAQMDQYIPLAQRSKAQALARTLEEDAASKRAAALAAADLGMGAGTSAGMSAGMGSAAAPVAAAPVPAPAPVQVAVSTPAPAPAAAPVAAPVVARTITPGASAMMPAAPRAAPVVAAAAPAAVRAAAPAAVMQTGSWRVQLGAFGVAGNADKLWSSLAGNPALAGTTKALVPTGRITRLHAVGFASKAAAEEACSALERQGQACIVVGNS